MVIFFFNENLKKNSWGPEMQKNGGSVENKLFHLNTYALMATNTLRVMNVSTGGRLW